MAKIKKISRESVFEHREREGKVYNYDSKSDIKSLEERDERLKKIKRENRQKLANSEASAREFILSQK